MKKALLASTALVAMSGAAVAQGVTLSGSAEMGIADNGTDDVQFHQDIDVTFKMEAVTNGGLTFGAAVDIDELNAESVPANDPINPATEDDADDGGVAVYVNGAFGNVTLGDTDGGFDWALDETAGVGSLADNETSHAGYSSANMGGGNAGLDGDNDGQILRYDNSFGDFAVGLSFEQDVAGGGPGDTVGVGVKGSFADIGFGVGFQQHDQASLAGMSVKASFGEMSGVLNYSRLSADEEDAGEFVDQTHTAVGVTYESGDVAININAGRFNYSGNTPDVDGVGVAAHYDLGGGAKVQFGMGSDDDKDTWSLGLAMSF